MGENTCGGSYFPPEEQSASALNTIAGYNGTPYVAVGDALMTDPCIAFQSWDDATVISVLKDEIGTNQIDLLLNFGGITIPKGTWIWFGFTAHGLDLSAGSGIYLKASPFTVL